MAAAPPPLKRNLSFPRLHRIKLSHFSLYSLTDEIEFEVGNGITCLAGANGLGKSTFLQVVGYGMTGVVPKPEQKFVSVDDYYRDISKFTRDYFDGRIRPENMEIAEIELEMSLGTQRVTIKRGFVESESLRELHVTTSDGTNRHEKESPEQKHLIYERIIAQSIGLSTFREFVFVQYFILTFDERRHLLFWDPKVLETCLLIFLGVNKEERTEVERLRREEERSGSRVRNYVFEIKKVKDRLAELDKATKNSLPSSQDSKTYEEYELLHERIRAANDSISLVRNKVRDAKLAIADSAARTSTLRTEYNLEFANRLQAKKNARQHPIIQQALVDHLCGICGAAGEPVATEVRSKIEEHKCALCDSEIPKGPEASKLMSRIKELDAALSQERKILDSNTLHVSQLEEEQQKQVEELSALQKELHDFEITNEEAIKTKTSSTSGLVDLRNVYEQQIASITKDRDAERERGKKVTQQYKAAQKRLEQQYLNIQNDFVPRFNSLAKLFLGVDLDIILGNGSNVTLVLEVQKTKRHSDYQLSESQRFFIDIALRMAFAQFTSPKGEEAPLYIDTPEGSLDLAYEAQAGAMIARFARAGHKVFMTANINTSQLLGAIASNSKSNEFAFQRLYHWTQMSSVQEKQEDKFEKTLNRIEKLANSA